MAKHELLKLISEKKGEAPPQPARNIAYNGELHTIPTTVSGISSLTIAKLRSILKFHHIPIIGNKDQLVLRVHLLRHNKLDAVTAREERQLEDLISVVRSIIRKQKSLSITHHIYRIRKYTLHSSSTLVPVPIHVKSVDDLNLLFEPLLSFIREQKNDRRKQDESTAFQPSRSNQLQTSEDVLLKRVSQTGARIKVNWEKEEVKDSGWKPGWYVATVHNYVEETDILTITYASEPHNPYEEELTPLIGKGKIKLVWSPL